VRDVANYQLRLNNVLSGRGLLQRVCVHKCFLTVTDLTARDMCSRAISSHEAADNLTLRQAQPARRMTAALSIAARMAFPGSAGQLAAKGIGGAGMHTGCRHSAERTQRSRKLSGSRGDAALLWGNGEP
jgi:hypothetical protein